MFCLDQYVYACSYQVRNQVLQVHPAVEAARQLWMGSLHRVMASVCLLPRFNSTNSSRPLKYGGEPTAWEEEESDEERRESDPLKPKAGGTYRVIASRIPQEVLDRAHASIDSELICMKNLVHFEELSLDSWLGQQRLFLHQACA